MRPAGALRLRLDQIAHHVPQCCEIFAVDLAVERLAFRRLLYGFHGEPPCVVSRFIDSILTIRVASMTPAKTNEKNRREVPMKLHGYFRSSASYRARIALNAKGLR